MLKTANLAIVQERHRLARDLHDSVTQSLYGIALAAQSALWLLNKGIVNEKVQGYVEYAHTSSKGALTEMREQLYRLHPTALNEDLLEALRQHCDLLRTQHNLIINLKTKLDVPLSDNYRNSLYYIAREALWNVVKHANATQVSISLLKEEQKIVFVVEDNGVGFDLRRITQVDRRGLKNIKERTARLGGKFIVNSEPGQGTALKIQLPIVE